MPTRQAMPILAAMAAALLGLAGAKLASAATSPFPALAEPPSQERHVGKIVFAELVTPDILAAERFYGGLFGWTFHDVQAGGGQFAQAAAVDGVPVAELAQRAVPAGQPLNAAWLTFIAVADVDAAVPAAVKSGATVLYPPHALAGFGREAILRDPQGAVFAIVASSSGDPVDTLAAPGAWIWSSLLTSDPDKGAAFYQDLFGYDVFDLPDDPRGQHLILASGNYARAGVNPLPADRPDARPRWLDYVRVDDAAAVAAKAQSLGGRVLVPPRPDRYGGRIAVVADPSGAPFGLMEWRDDAAANTGVVK